MTSRVPSWKLVHLIHDIDFCLHMFHQVAFQVFLRTQFSKLPRNVDGQNDAPAASYRTFDHEAYVAGWARSRFDPCLYTLRTKGPESTLVGVMGVHVDDIAAGGMGPLYQQSIESPIETQVSFSEVENWSSRFLWRLLQTRSYHQRDFDVPIFLCRAFQTSIICSKGSQSRQAFGPCPNPSVARHQWQPQLDCKSIQARSSSTDQPRVNNVFQTLP